MEKQLNKQCQITVQTKGIAGQVRNDGFSVLLSTFSPFTFHLSLIFIISLCVSCRQNQIHLSGKFENADKRYLLLSKIAEADDVVFIDTLLLLNGRFSHTVTEEKIGIYLLKYDDNTLLSFIAQNGDRLVFSGDVRNLNRTYDVQGNEETRLFLEMWHKLNQFKDKTKEWAAIFERHKYMDDYEEICRHLDSLYSEEFAIHKEYLTQFIHQHRGKLATLPAFYQKIGYNAFFDKQKDRPLLQEIYNGLLLTYPNSVYTADLKEMLE
jgi:hypothetical protein